MSVRERIAMTPDEIQAFLEAEKTLTCATIGLDGWPHLMPLWYVVREGECWAWTYAKSQKVRNLERESRCTVQVEAGRQYHELRGVMMKCVAAIHRDLETVAGVGSDLAERYGGTAADMRKQAPKRVALQFIANSVASWDHGKL
jgi:general stress protein 26